MFVIPRLGAALLLISSATFAAPAKNAAKAPPEPPAASAPAAVVATSPTVAVIGLRSTISLAEKQKLDDEQLAEVIREAAERALPGAKVLTREDLPAAPEGCGLDCQLQLARKAGATLVVTGDLLRVDHGLLASLELRDADTASMLSFESAIAGNTGELPESISRASADLFASKAPVSSIPTMPDVPGEVSPSEVQADPQAMADYDAALRADNRGKENPGDAEVAWEKLASRGGNNPYRDEANARAAQWHTWQETRAAFDAQHRSDTENLKKLLPLATTGDVVKLRLLARFAHAYGADEARPFIAMLPPALTAQAGLILACEGGEAEQCVSLVRLDEESKDANGALTHLQIACEAGAAAACAELGDRLLAATARDPARAIPALQRGCAMGNGRACARLARLYEEADGTDANLAVAAELRARACDEGDGRSCRKLGNSLEGEDAAADLVKAVELWKRACTLGDQLACRMSRAATPKKVKRPAPPPAPMSRSWRSVDTRDSTKVAAKRVVGVLMIGAAEVLATVGLSQTGPQEGHGEFRGGGLDMHRATPYLIGAAASATIGLIVLMTPVETKHAQVAVGTNGSGLVLSGKFQ